MSYHYQLSQSPSMRNYFIRIFYRKVPTDIDTDYHRILLAYSSYYTQLHTPLKARFRLRLYHLLNIVGFHSPKIPMVSREVRVVIGSSIIQITFGLSNYLPIRFKTVIVMPTRYMYPGYGEPFLGHIDYTKRALYFSWNDVKHGYEVPDDAVNVALHEMAHVLEAENRYRSMFDRFFRAIDWMEWAGVAFEKMNKIRTGNSAFLKEYGGSNMTEMFAVCVETYFEQPHEFKRQLPQIYKTMTTLLQQDPTRRGNPLL